MIGIEKRGVQSVQCKALPRYQDIQYVIFRLFERYSLQLFPSLQRTNIESRKQKPFGSQQQVQIVCCFSTSEAGFKNYRRFQIKISLYLTSMYINFFYVAIVALGFLRVTTANRDVWNRYAYFESQITFQDYDPSSVDTNSTNKLEYKAFSLQLFSNHTFSLFLEAKEQSDSVTFEGDLSLVDHFSLRSRIYQLESKEISGSVKYEINKGLKWAYNIVIAGKYINISREEIKYSYVNEIALLLFGILGVVVLPLSDNVRNKMLYNIRKRTHFAFSYFILLKLTFVVGCFLLNCYYFITNSAWYFIFLAYGIYLFMISPSIIHSMYFITSIQRQLKQNEWFKQSKAAIKCLIMSFVILSIPGLAAILLYFSKGIVFFFICSLATLYQYLQACKSKRYSFGKVIIYDLLLTFILSLFSSFMPSLNFTLMTYKQEVLFWNYYLAMFIFGVVLTRIIIKSEIAQELYLDQNNDSEPVQTESQRRHQLPKINTNEVLQA